MTLCELTEQGAGVVWHYDKYLDKQADEVIVCNWQNYVYGKLPVIDPLGISIIPYPFGELELLKKYRVENVLDELDGARIISYEDVDLQIPGTVYELTNGAIIIAPDGWN